MQSRTEFTTKNIIVPTDCPDIILAVGPCRSGTTALNRVFALNGLISIYQPLKALRKSHNDGEESASFLIPSGSNKVFIKETLGPTLDEAQINPIKSLIESGVPSEKIKLLAIMRAPVETLASWNDTFRTINSATLTDNAITAYKTTEAIINYARDNEIENTVFTYDLLKDHPPQLLLETMFVRLGLSLSPDVFQDWTNLPTIGTEKSNIIIPPGAEKHYSLGKSNSNHQTLDSSHGFVYVARATDNIDKQTRTRLEMHGIISLYDKMKRESEIDLKLEEYLFNEGDGIGLRSRKEKGF